MAAPVFSVANRQKISALSPRLRIGTTVQKINVAVEELHLPRESRHVRSNYYRLLLIFLGVVSRAEAAETPQAKLYRAINLNGPSLRIDGAMWESGDTANFRCNGNAFENQSVPLKPATDPERARMLRSSRWGRQIDVELLSVPDERYQVCLYVWEDNDSTTFSIQVNGQTVIRDHASGTGGTWKRLGPWLTRPENGVIRISARGGDANLSGLEVWSGVGAVPNPLTSSFNSRPTDDELAFFESRIRPLLVKHCHECHSVTSKDPGGNLLVDSRPGLIRGGDGGTPIVPGDAEASLLIQAVRQANPDLKMPPEGKLSSAEIADLERWVLLRAPDPRLIEPLSGTKPKSAIDWEQARNFWSLKPLIPAPVPQVADHNWPAGVIDRWILSRLESAGLHPAPDADKSTLLRRVTYDLIGLPPTPEELAAFEADPSETAYEQVVQRLLESPHHGERWGRHWLDVVRYADTAGDNSDFPIPQMYRYRNWVIDAFNRDLPFDQFVREQLAGDLLGGTANEAQQRLIATGYIANARRFGSRVDDYPQHLTIEDTLDNLGRTFLGMTINCARCHNHKFDPITADDYYGLYGIFQSTRYPWPGIELEQKQRDLVPLIPADEVQRILTERRQQLESLEARVRELEKEEKSAPADQRPERKKQREAAQQAARQFAQSPLPFEQAYAVAEAAVVTDAVIQLKGDPSKRGATVPRHFLTVLSGDRLPENDRSSGRLQLANWIVDKRNPLTSRVIVNRIWLSHFGKGLVPTPNDFGRQGKPPTHPELLDALAIQFMDSGWSIKQLHRQIVLSRTYRQSSQRESRAFELDPANDLYAGFPRRRLDAESIRDTLLLLGGHLDRSPGGPHPFPPQSEWKFTQHNPFKAVYDSNRRSVYLMTQRIQRHPYLAIFDGPDPAASTPLRLTSTTPLQALYLMNDEFVHQQAAGLANRLISENVVVQQRIVLAYRLILSRDPSLAESDSALQFLDEVRQALHTARVPEDQLESQSWQSLLRALFRLNEFAYID